MPSQRKPSHRLKCPPYITVVAALILIIGAGAMVVLVKAQTETKTFSGSANLQYGDAGGTVGNNVTIHQKVIYLKNTGSDPDTFRTTLPVNPEARCGIKGPTNGSYPANTLPNPLPTTLDVPLVVNNETTYMVVVCVTQGLAPGPFTWSYKTVSVGALDAGGEKVIADVQDTVQVTEAIPCSDSDGGINTSIKGIATGTYAGAVTSYTAIYGQEPNPTSPKTTTDKFSTFIDHCATSTQLNEGFCASDGSLNALGTSCPYGCKDGVCSALSSSSSSLSSSSSISSGIPVCTPNGAIRSICMCGSEQYGYEPNHEFYKVYDNSGYCCSDNGRYTYAWPGPCATPPSTSSAPSSAVSQGDATPLCPINEAIKASCMCDATRWDGGYCCRAPAGYLFHTTPGPCSAVDNPPPPSSSQVVTAPTTSPSQPISSTPSPASPQTPTTAVPTATHPVPSPDHPKALTESTTHQKKVSRARVQALKKQQQALRRELRSLERSLLRKKNVAAIAQVADLRDALYDLDLRDPSAAETLQSLQEEIADLRLVVSKTTHIAP